MAHHRKSLFGSLAVLTALIVACVQDDDSQPASDEAAKRGFDLLINKPLSSPVMEIDELNRLWTIWEPELKAEAEKATPEERRRMTFERYGLTHREFDDSGLPLGYVDDGQGNLVTNCFSCHGGKVAGKSVPGLANSHQDLTGLVTDLNKLKMADRGGDPNKVMGTGVPYPANFAKGTSNATMFSIILGAMRDENLDLWPSQGIIPTMKLKQQLVHNSVDAPPWWHYKHKELIYCDAMAPAHHRTLMQFTMSPSISGEQIRSFEPDFKYIEEYIKNVEAPKYPFKIDHTLAAKGEKVFNETCARCHGTYGEKREFPNKVIPIAEIGTDDTRLRAIAPESKAQYNKSWFSEYGKYPAVVDVKGYLAQPLDGIWATAPYLHNGSVPTIAHLFNPESRPKIWKRTEDGYDEKRVGIEVEEVDAIPEGLPAREKRLYYNTATPSHGNGGHLFPDEELNAEEKLWVMEYLKTL